MSWLLMKLLNNKRRFPRIKLYAYYKRDFWQVIKLTDNLKYRRFAYSLLKGTRRFYKEILINVFKGQHFFIKRYTRHGMMLVIKKAFKLFCSTIRDAQITKLGYIAKRLPRRGVMENFCGLFELRTDMLIWRSLFVRTIRVARYYIYNANIFCNTRLIRSPIIRFKVGDILSVRQVVYWGDFFLKRRFLLNSFYMQRYFCSSLRDFLVYVLLLINYFFEGTNQNFLITLFACDNEEDVLFLDLDDLGGAVIDLVFNFFKRFLVWSCTKGLFFFKGLSYIRLLSLRFVHFYFFFELNGKKMEYFVDNSILLDSQAYFLYYADRVHLYDKIIRHKYSVKNLDKWVLIRKYKDLSRKMWVYSQFNLDILAIGLIGYGYPLYLECNYKLFRSLVVRFPNLYDFYMEFTLSLEDVFAAYRSRGFF